MTDMRATERLRRVGILCPKCGLHEVRTIKTCKQIADDLKASPDWRRDIERRTAGLLNSTEVTMDDIARGYALRP